MDRKEFIIRCGVTAIGALLEGCGSTKYIAAEIEESSLVVPLGAFEYEKDGEKRFRRYIIAENDRLEYPICVYRLQEAQYYALLMRCTHQGTELRVFGDRLQCPAHGSEFSNTGEVKNGPADTALRGFPVNLEKERLKIDLT